MRDNLSALKQIKPDYTKKEHSALFKNMRIANRGYYHLREGYKDDMPFICLIVADLSSLDNKIIGEIGGRDDNNSRKTDLIHIRFEARLSIEGKILINILSSDFNTTYPESLRLVSYCLSAMSKKSIELTRDKSGGGGKGKKGFYPSLIGRQGRFATFDKTFDKAVSELVLPEDFRDFFRTANYNLVFYKG
ncbi:MAG: hypothetical protein COW00_14040 [Bdellovibrio sp. CG12_big_fil_rev_8_21_14_0_65_39_13]|nr:MAG: hypothetical protein COW78_08215 [Bdellovibrio sp. CG22_combo_CG10-13_8_21_14_all_39_27]PIQ58733.1 MAG: hypothetical protein COW00_14040 [Bdellovibrio sp. CG12_big_fil_rev_8_21_14_0_65_39_13]PIR35586.1 MAG: hypothetical protein COV37_08920 [Bdellovibrio sp. CG11_big_fil_rev_8_21_14_0_20_39_38]